MTEAEWLTCAQPWPMIGFLGPQASDRKLRLFAVACCRNVLHHCSENQVATSIEVLDRYADGLATNSERSSARRAVHKLILSNTRDQSGDEQAYWQAHVNNAALWAVYWACEKKHDIASCCTHCALVEARLMQRNAKMVNGDQASAWRKARESEWSRQAVMLRDIFGNPFRPLPTDPSWRTPSVVSLAQTIYRDRAFDLMPRLADTLQQAGCMNADILQHCCVPGPHVPGCWVLDLLLGNA